MRCYNCKNSNWIRVDKDWSCKRMPFCKAEDCQKRKQYSKLNIKVGSKIRFKNEKRFYTVRAIDDRFIIAYRNWKYDYYYTICDLEDCIRGADNYHGYYDYKYCSDLELREALYRLNMGQSKLLKDCKDLPEDLKVKQINEMNAFGKVPEDRQWLNNLEISHRNWTNLEIEEVK